MKKNVVAMAVAGISLAAVAGAALVFPGFGGEGAAKAQTQTQTAPANAEAQPQRIETTVHESWTVTCQDTADKKNTCTAVLRVADNQSGNVVLVWAIGKDMSGKLTAVMQTPTGVQLAPGVILKVGKGADRKLTYATCSPRQCDATAPFDAAFLKDVNAAEEATAVITLIDGRAAEFKFPLKGSASALKLVTAS
ncbi:invasion associated locus B family protein [Pseudochelatococcus sp. G4_1912]|uniref:invasion associated locus B family protein n=1 Tax=Pseudochelatococcus sp. G4_1912 TaxID=3114288 RepID=UPI0039C754CA